MSHDHPRSTDQHQHQHHHHAHDHPHGSIRLVSPAEQHRLTRPVHRIGRRRFLTELGRHTFAVAILGGVAAACSDETGDAGFSQPPDSPVTDPETAASTGPQAGPTTPVSDPQSGSGGESAPGAEQLQWAQVDLGFVSAFVVVRGNTAAVVDTGQAGSVDAIGSTLATLGVTFDDVRHVVLTHHHGDHVGSLPEVLDRAGSAVSYAGAADIPNIPSPADVVAVADGDDVFGLEVIETPGHTPGSIAVLDTGIGLLIAGDALNGNDDGTAVLGPNERFTSDMATASQSVSKLAGFDFESAAFGHGQPVVGGAGVLVKALAAG